MTKYTCIGFDIRVWPCDGVPGVGLSDWSQHGAMHAAMLKKFGLQENLYQLLHIENQQTLDAVTQAIQADSTCNLIAIQIPAPVAAWQNERFGLPLEGLSLSLAGFQCMGIDVADTNGFFSVLAHPVIARYRNTSALIGESQLDEILQTVQLAGFVARDHAPYSAVRISALKL